MKRLFKQVLRGIEEHKGLAVKSRAIDALEKIEQRMDELIEHTEMLVELNEKMLSEEINQELEKDNQ